MISSSDVGFPLSLHSPAASNPTAVRRSQRKRKVSQSQSGAPPPSALLVHAKAREVVEGVFSLLSEMLLLGVVVEPSLEMEISQTAASVTNTGETSCLNVKVRTRPRRLVQLPGLLSF